VRSDEIVVVVMDDVGVDKVAAYGVHPRPAPTPRLDDLATRAALFRSAYAEPSCSPSRAALLTGRRPSRTGIGRTVAQDDPFDLRDVETTLPEALRAADERWSTMAIGKWHLSAFDALAPVRHGFDRFDGILANPREPFDGDEVPNGYSHWQHDVDGVLSWSNDYLTTQQADAAIAAVRSLPEPFLLYVAFSAAHEPLHVPPEALWSASDPTDPIGQGDAMIEALDHEIGRFLDAVDPDATVIVVGDNGTQDDLVRPPADRRHAKLTVYTGGTHVPLLVSAPWVAPGPRDGLAHVTDLFATVLDLAGVDPPAPIDGVSLVPALSGGDGARRCVVVEQFAPNGQPDSERDVAVIEDRFTLVRHEDRPDELYARDAMAPVEGDDLLSSGTLDPAARDALSRMRAYLRHDNAGCCGAR
jgi:arylsulfatase A-like enzyme